MRTVRALVAIPIALMFLGACGDDTSSTTPDASTIGTLSTEPTDATETTISATTSDTTSDTTTVGAVSTAAQVTTVETAVDGPMQIDVIVGVDSSEDRIVQVKVGADLTLNITNPDAADEFHVHGVELEQAVDAGVMATLNFTIGLAGTYEVESHITHDVLLVIEAT